MRATDNSILNIIRSYGHVFVIPPFQRNYEWTKEQCEELFEDVLNLYQNPNKRHFLGNIVYYLGENQGVGFAEYILVDGQQRITSILLLLCAIRDLMEDEQAKSDINRSYLRNDQNIARHSPVRIKQTSYDREVFERLIMCRELDENAMDSNIYTNYNIFRSLLLEHNLNTSDSLRRFTQAMAQIDVVDVNLETGNDLAAVQTIFEKINSTGKPLSHADLIRNYLLVSNNLEDQERLYEEYWVRLEETLGAENVKDFAKCFFTIKAKESVNDSRLYYAFKQYFNELGCSKESILREMNRLSTFYKWLSMECCPNARINYFIQEFNVLQAKDMYSLYIDLFDRLYYSNNVNQLLEIFGVLSDFLIRFRIVGKGHGGAAIKNIVVELLNTIHSEDFTLSAETIRYELSRNNGEKKYPDDDEFKQALKGSRKYNHTYGKVVLRRIEDRNGNALNIPTPLTLMTVEHFMPQTRTDWWVRNLGGAENSNRVYNLYLNSIGNLGIMSGPLNTRISNRPWPEKRDSIRETQFNVTRVDSERWTEEEIRQRNDELADLAVNYITGPVPVDSIAIDGDSGEYPASDINTNLTGASVIAYRYDDTLTSCDAWQTIWDFVVKKCYECDANLFRQIVRENIVHKATRNPVTNCYYPIIVDNVNDSHSLLIRSGRVENTEYYYEKNLNSERIRAYSNLLLSNFNLLERMSYIVRFPDLEDE